jgi:hypothetical protein
MGKKSKKMKWDGILFPPAVGYYFSILINLYRKNKVQGKYYLRLFMLGAINLINKPFRFYERYFINPGFKEKTLENSPVFFLGIWVGEQPFCITFCAKILIRLILLLTKVFFRMLFSVRPAGFCF